MKKIFWILLLGIIIFFTAEWTVVGLLATRIGQKNKTTKKINDLEIISLIKNKTGVEIESIKIIPSTKLYGAMIGIPKHPYMMFSDELFRQFNKQEIEYVAIHEAGHYVLNHTVKELVFFLIIWFVGTKIMEIFKTRKGIFVLISGFVLGLLFIQYQKINEYEADRFAVERVSDLKAMVSATEKFEAQNNNRINDQGIIWKIFYRGVPYSERIKMAELGLDRK